MPAAQKQAAVGAIVLSAVLLFLWHTGSAGSHTTHAVVAHGTPAALAHLGTLPPAGEAECIRPVDGERWLQELPGANMKIFSQNGEDGLMLAILRNIGTTNLHYVEFGVENGMECNSRVLRMLGWKGLMMDGSHFNPDINLQQERITPDNINELFEKHGVPPEFDVLSIDLDYDDYWVFDALDEKYRPRVLIMEVNSAIPLAERRVVVRGDTRRWTGNCYFGASIRATYDLMKRRGYTLVAVDDRGVNAFSVRSDILECQGLKPPPLEKLYRSVVYHTKNETDTSRVWVILDEGGNEVQRDYLPNTCQGL